MVWFDSLPQVGNMVPPRMAAAIGREFAAAARGSATTTSDWVGRALPALDVRPPTTWTVLQQDGPNHLGLWHSLLPEHQLALITSGCVPLQVHSHWGSRARALEAEAAGEAMVGVLSAVGETVILLHPPSPFSRCFNRHGGEAVSAE